MKKPITAAQREKLRRSALFMPAGYIALGVVSTEDVRPVLYPGDWGGTLVFDVGEGKPQRFRVFDPAASAALIQKALDETRAQTQKGPTT